MTAPDSLPELQIKYVETLTKLTKEEKNTKPNCIYSKSRTTLPIPEQQPHNKRIQ